MIDRMPAIGSFLWPVGRSYCAEVVAVYPSVMGVDGRPGLPRVYFRRWGWKDGAPWDDGHRCDGRCGVALRPRGPRCWSSPGWYPDEPRYGFQLWLAVTARPGGQGALFT